MGLMSVLMLSIFSMNSQAFPDSEPGIYHYDFNTDHVDWKLQPGVWSRVSLEGGNHALRGSGNGFASLTAHSGEVSLLRFRFRLEGLQSRLHANVLESFVTSSYANFREPLV